MTNPTVRIHNTETNEVIDREMTDDEFANYQTEQIERAAKKAEEEAKATARQAILDRLGISAEEAQLLLGGN
jgi:hypothetical protein